MVCVAPSLLAADFSRLGEEVDRITGADLLHIDIMDGVFVPNISFGPQVLRSLRGRTKLPFDVHLMLKNPLPYIPVFREAGADYISFHAECGVSACDALSAIERSGAAAGMAIKPGTDPEILLPYGERLGIITVMTVEPGFGGQELIPSALEKIPWIKRHFPRALVEVDGGINEETAPLARAAGADILVAGTAVFRSADPERELRLLRGE